MFLDRITTLSITLLLMIFFHRVYVFVRHLLKLLACFQENYFISFSSTWFSFLAYIWTLDRSLVVGHGVRFCCAMEEFMSTSCLLWMRQNLCDTQNRMYLLMYIVKWKIWSFSQYTIHRMLVHLVRMYVKTDLCIF